MQSSLQGLMSNPSLSQFISNLAKDSSFADIAGLGFNSGIPDANGLSLGGGPPGTSDFTTAPIPGNPAVSDSMRVKRGFPDDFSNAPAPHHHGRVRRPSLLCTPLAPTHASVSPHAAVLQGRARVTMRECAEWASEHGRYH